MKILIEESVLRQALEAIGAALGDDKPYLNKCRSSYVAIESALDAAEKVEPVAWLYKDAYGKLKVSQIEEHDEHDFPVFTHPAPAVPEKIEPAIDPNCRCDEHGACAYCWNGKKHDTHHAPAAPEVGADKEE